VPELNGQGPFCEQLCRDLENRGLIAQGSKTERNDDATGDANAAHDRTGKAVFGVHQLTVCAVGTTETCAVVG